MGENYFNFAFSTAVVKSTVEPADGHSPAEARLPLLCLPSSGQYWAALQMQMGIPDSWPWTSLQEA